MEKTENPGKNDGKIEEEAKDSAALESAKQSEAASLESQEDEAQKDGLDSSSKVTESSLDQEAQESNEAAQEGEAKAASEAAQENPKEEASQDPAKDSMEASPEDGQSNEGGQEASNEEKPKEEVLVGVAALGQGEPKVIATDEKAAAAEGEKKEVKKEPKQESEMVKWLKATMARDATRIWSAVAMIGALVIVLGINSLTLTWAVMGILYLIAMNEGALLHRTSFGLASFCMAVLLWIGLYFSSNSLAVVGCVLCVVALYLIKDSSDSSGKRILPFIYPTLPFVAIYVIYSEYGVWFLVWLLLAVSVADVCAYYGGKRFGSTPLCTASPNKTWEGAVCGLVLGVAVGTITGIGIFDGFFCSLFATIFIIVLSMIGDLLESALKRRAEVKDSSNILPGHGGLLDRIDAIMFGAVAMLLVLSIMEMYKQ